MANLSYIQSDRGPAADIPIGVLTSESRDVWTRVREQLISAGEFDSIQVCYLIQLFNVKKVCNVKQVY